jgi:5-hydroxyisourate hydrolase-like protein (transthyretin family)
VTSSWDIPANVSLGVYDLSISNATVDGTVKSPADLQSFVVAGLCSIQVRNLANEAVAGVRVEIWNATSGSYLNLWEETNESGSVEFTIDKAGNYTFKAFWKDPLGEAGAINQTITGDTVFSLTVWLAHIKLTVRDEAGNPLPWIDLNLKYNYTGRSGTIIPTSDLVTTNVTGSVQIVNTFANVSYLVEASRYGFPFPHTTNIQSLSAGWNNYTVIAPTYTIFVQMRDSQDAPAKSLQVTAYDWSSGISQPAKPPETTDENGNVTFSLTFGRYRLRVHKDATFVKEVTVDVAQNLSFLVVRIDVYNVDLNVIVIDYFGQPIPNVSVEFQRKSNSDYEKIQNKNTGSIGVASFSDVIGGDSRVYVSVGGRPGETRYLYLVGSQPNDIVFKLERYVVLVGNVLETSQFVTLTILLIIIVALIVASTYKRLLGLFQRRRK